MKKSDRYPLILLVIYVIATIISFIGAFSVRGWLVEHIAPVAILLILILTYKKFRFSNTSYTLMLLALLLNSIGAHYLYSNVPYPEFINSFFGFSRNHFDRLAHFLFGVFLYLPSLELTTKLLKIKQKTFFIYLIPLFIVLSLGALYEVLELSAALISPNSDLAINFLGSQGDIWDTNKDLALKFISGMIAMFFFYFRDRKN